METSLHRELKDRYGLDRGRLGARSRSAGFRIDAVDDEGTLIEVQSGPLGSLKSKLRALVARASDPGRQAGRGAAPRSSAATARTARTDPAGRARSAARCSTSSTTWSASPHFSPDRTSRRVAGRVDRRGPRHAPATAGLSRRRSSTRSDPGDPVESMRRTISGACFRSACPTRSRSPRVIWRGNSTGRCRLPSESPIAYAYAGRSARRQDRQQSSLQGEDVTYSLLGRCESSCAGAESIV